MIIAGNSNVDCFHRLKTNIPIKVSWVGALKAKHFYDNYRMGNEIRRLFDTEDWKFLSIGTHDMRFSDYPTISETLEKIQKIFLEFKGKFGWIIFPQPPATDIGEVLFFNGALKKFCIENNIVVIDPLNSITDPSTHISLPEFMQEDKNHVNAIGAGIYLKEISKVTGIDIEFEYVDLLFEPLGDNESFASLIMNDSKMPIEFQKDCLLSLKGSFSNEVIEAEERISHLPEDVFERIKEKVRILSNTEGENYGGYGIVLFWIALNYYQRGNKKLAKRLLLESGMEGRFSPINEMPQFNYYKNKWGIV